MKQLLYGAALFSLSVFFSCKDEYTLCTLAKDVNFTAGFYQRAGGADIVAPAPSLSVLLLNNPNPIYSQQPNAATFALPLNPVTDSARYLIILSNSTPADTLTIVYTSQNSTLSPECGTIATNNITRLYSTLHTIDSVKITASAVTTTPTLNAKIYY